MSCQMHHPTIRMHWRHYSGIALLFCELGWTRPYDVRHKISSCIIEARLLQDVRFTSELSEPDPAPLLPGKASCHKTLHRLLQLIATERPETLEAQPAVSLFDQALQRD